MANSIADLVINLIAETASLRTGLNDAVQQTQQAAQKMEQAFDFLKGFAEGFVGAFSFEKLFESLIRVSEEIESIGKAAQKTGIDVEHLSGLRFAAFMADITDESLDTALIRFNKNLAESITKGGAASQVLNGLGISTDRATVALMGTDGILLKLADRFSAMPDGPQKTADAIALFGKAGADMIPLLNTGSEGIQKMSEHAKELGLTFDPDAVEKANRFNDSLKELKATAEGVAAQFARNSGSLRLWVDGVREAVVDFKGAFGDLIAFVIATGTTIAAYLNAVIRIIAGDVAVISAMIAHAAVGDFDAAKHDWSEFDKYVTEKWKDAADQTKEIWGKANKDISDGSAKTVDAYAAMRAAGGPTFVLGDQTDHSKELERALDFFRQLQVKLAKANDDVIGEINARWGEELAKAAEQYKKFPELRGQYLDAELQITIAKRKEIAAAEQKLLIDANKAAADLTKGSLEGTLLTIPTNVGRHPAPSLTFNPLQAQLDVLSGVNAKDAESQLKAAQDRGAIMDQAFESTRTHAQQLAFQIQKLDIAFGDDRESDTYKKALQGLKDQFDINTIALNSFAQQAGSAFQEAILHTHDFEAALVDVIEQLGLMILKMEFAKSIEGMTQQGGTTGFFGGLLGGLLGIGHASGGPVTAGMGYVIGENGPESFVPSTDGYVMPNSALQSMGSGMSVTYAIDARGADAGVEARVMRAIRASHDSAVQTSMARIYDRQKRR